MTETPPLPRRATAGLRPEEALERLAVFAIGYADEQNFRLVREVFQERSHAIVARFYEHLMAFPECRAILVPEPLVERLQRTQRAYLATLGDFRIEDVASVLAYFEHRMRVGLAHHRVGLPPRLYAGAYAKLGALATEAIAAAHPQKPDLLVSLHKILGLDNHLALEAYQQTHEELVYVAAFRDPLTGVGNRASTLDSLQREIARAHRFGHPLSLLFIDVDRFKQVNDTLGHAAGDAMLRSIAQTLEASVRPADVVGRYGGDEFVVGLIETEEKDALAIAERIRAGSARATSGTDATLSIGVAALEVGDTLEDLLTRADRAMYGSKAAGRDKVSIAPRTSPT